MDIKSSDTRTDIWRSPIVGGHILACSACSTADQWFVNGHLPAFAAALDRESGQIALRALLPDRLRTVSFIPILKALQDPRWQSITLFIPSAKFNKRIFSTTLLNGNSDQLLTIFTNEKRTFPTSPSRSHYRAWLAWWDEQLPALDVATQAVWKTIQAIDASPSAWDHLPYLIPKASQNLARQHLPSCDLTPDSLLDATKALENVKKTLFTDGYLTWATAHLPESVRAAFKSWTDYELEAYLSTHSPYTSYSQFSGDSKNITSLCTIHTCLQQNTPPAKERSRFERERERRQRWALHGLANPRFQNDAETEDTPMLCTTP